MKNRIMAAVVSVCIVAGPVLVKAYDDGDAQCWLQLSSGGKIGESMSVKAEEQLRYGDNMSELYDAETLMMLDMKMSDVFSVGAGYRQVYERKNRGTVGYQDADGVFHRIGSGDHYWTEESRPTLDLVFKTKIAAWSIEDRIRTEYRMKEGSDEYFRYRNRIKVKSPWKITGLKINPWAAWEAFYSDTDEDPKWDRHRIYAGITVNLAEHVSGGIYYMRQSDDKGSEWLDYNVAGVDLGCTF